MKLFAGAIALLLTLPTAVIAEQERARIHEEFGSPRGDGVYALVDAMGQTDAEELCAEIDRDNNAVYLEAQTHGSSPGTYDRYSCVSSLGEFTFDRSVLQAESLPYCKPFSCLVTVRGV